MEIERKWMVTGWPAGLEQTSVYNMDQGYISVRPTVRIRREALQGGPTALVLCFKGEGGLSREEIETEIDAALFARLEHLIGKPLIHKERRGYQLPGGLTLEVNCVDPDLPTAFWYAEVEFETEAQALAWDPAGCGLADYLHEECTGKPGSSMGEYWLQTRKKESLQSTRQEPPSAVALRHAPAGAAPQGKAKICICKIPRFRFTNGWKTTTIISNLYFLTGNPKKEQWYETSSACNRGAALPDGADDGL